MPELRIIFMGTPEFAVPSLEKLLENQKNVIAVITAPDKPQGRGQKIIFSPVKECALKYGVAVLQPTNLKSPEFIEQLKSLRANLQIVVAFRMLPEVVWSMPEFGTFNLHASLLPQYRGAAPINWAVINGEKETGVTTFFLKHEIDTGSVIFQETEPIGYDDNVGSVYQRLMHKGSSLVLKTVDAIESGQFPTTPQGQSGELKHAPKIFKETCEINWAQSAEAVRNFVRGLSPHPAAWTSIEGRIFKIYGAEVVQGKSGARSAEPVGELLTDNETYLHFRTRDGYISVTELQPEGKKRMTVADFFRGNKL
jgi:methionyl-tRNA formyltransferase